MTGRTVSYCEGEDAYLNNVWEDRFVGTRSEEHTSELHSHHDLVCRLLLEKKKKERKKLVKEVYHTYKP